VVGWFLAFLADSLIQMAWISKPLIAENPVRTGFVGLSEISRLEFKKQILKIVK
jgi:hypothetical protein